MGRRPTAGTPEAGDVTNSALSRLAEPKILNKQGQEDGVPTVSMDHFWPNRHKARMAREKQREREE